MVYMRLGEFEDPDERQYLAEENFGKPDEDAARDTDGLVSWAAVIFLTSVLEYMAEQCISVASAAAYDRCWAKRGAKPSVPLANGYRSGQLVVVEDYDVERIALSSMLGRLWRTWRKGNRGKNRAGSSSKLGSALSSAPMSPGALTPAALRILDTKGGQGLQDKRGGFVAGPAALGAENLPFDSDGYRQMGRANRPRSLDLKPPSMPYGLPTPEASSNVSPSHTTNVVEDRAWRRRSRSVPVNTYIPPGSNEQFVRHVEPSAYEYEQIQGAGELTPTLNAPGYLAGTASRQVAGSDGRTSIDQATPTMATMGGANPLQMNPVSASSSNRTSMDKPITRGSRSASAASAQGQWTDEKAAKHISDSSGAGTVFEEDNLSQGIPSGRQSALDEKPPRSVPTTTSGQSPQSTREVARQPFEAPGTLIPPRANRRSPNGADVIAYYENSHRTEAAAGLAVGAAAAVTAATTASAGTLNERATPTIKHMDDLAPPNVYRASGSSSQEAKRAANVAATQRSSTSSGSHLSGRTETLEREFGDLIASNQTMRYTLTPANLRSIEVSRPTYM